MADNVPKLGEIITGPAERDAVHVAVVPVKAGMMLAPGDHVGPLKDGRYGTHAEQLVGVVDPFLKDHVFTDQQFYMLLYPGTVISLRHVYRHPVLDHDEIRKETMEKLNAPAVEYIRACAAKIEMAYPDLVEALVRYADYGEYTDVTMNQSNNAMGVDWPKLWEAYAQLTGAPVPKNHEEPFNCKC